MTGSRFFLAIAALLTLGMNSSASAAILLDLQDSSSSQSSSPETIFDGLISSTDLINVGQSTLVNTTITTTSSSYSTAGLNNGSAGLRSFWGMTEVVPAFATFELDTVTNPFGYSITDIDVFLGHSSRANWYASHHYNISYSKVEAPTTFLPLISVDESPFSASVRGGSMLSLTSDTPSLASGVAQIRFEFLHTSTNTTAVFREIDIQGFATLPAPEPSSLLLASCGLIGLNRIRRRKRRVH